MQDRPSLPDRLVNLQISHALHSSRFPHIRNHTRQPAGNRQRSSTHVYWQTGAMVRHIKAARIQGHEPVQGVVSLRTVAVETPKSFATRAGLNPALTAARTMLAFAGGMSDIGAVRTICAAAGLFCSVTGGILRLLSPAAEAGPIPRRRASPVA